MWPSAVVVFILLSRSQAIAAPKGCPPIEEWRNATLTPGGPVVCAKLYATANCTGFSYPFGVNSTIPDLRQAFGSNDLEDWSITALIRPGCHVRMWTGTNYSGEGQLVSDYQWRGRIDSYSSADCRCEQSDIELLTCEPRGELWRIQWCNFASSEYGGICPYTFRRRPFRAGSEGENETFLTEVEASALRNVISSRLMASFGADLEYDEGVLKARVDAHETLSVHQRVLTCGPFHLPTPEIKFEREKHEARLVSFGQINSCDPEEVLVQIQYCDFSDSVTGGACPYTVRQRAYVTDPKSGNKTYLSDHEEQLLKIRTNFESKSKAHTMYREANDAQMGVHVGPYETLDVYQKMLKCGSLTVPTMEIDLKYGMRAARWIKNPVTGRSFYFSDAEENRTNADRYCKRMDSRLAWASRPEDYEFIARIAVKHFNDADVWWVDMGGSTLWPIGGKLTYVDHGGTWIGEQRRILRFNPVPDGNNKCFATTFLFRGSKVQGCSYKFRYVCEKQQSSL